MLCKVGALAPPEAVILICASDPVVRLQFVDITALVHLLTLTSLFTAVQDKSKDSGYGCVGWLCNWYRCVC